MAARFTPDDRRLPPTAMTAADRAPSCAGLASFAHAVSTVVYPTHLAIVTPLLVGAHAAGPSGLGWALLPAITTGVLPYLNARGHPSRGSKSARQVGLALASMLGGLAILAVAVALHAAPPAVLAVATALLATALVLAPITAWRRWNISIHAATASGCAVIIGWEIGFSPVLVAGLTLLVATVAWARVYQGHHSIAEATAGLVAGASVCSIVYTALV